MKTLKIITISLILTLILFSCNKNEFAPDIVDQEFEVEENSPAGTIIGVVEASDQDEGQIVVFEIVDGNDEGVCEIDASSGSLSVSDPTKLDYENITQIILTIIVSDEHKKEPLESSAKVKINIINVPEEKHIVINLQPDGDSGKDAVFCRIVPDNNYGELKDIHLYAWTQGGIINVNRVVIDFDLSSIPSEATIDSANLSLYFNTTSAYGDQHEGENSFIIQRIISEWEESTITWNSQPLTSTANQVSVNSATLPTQDFPEMDITALIQDYSNDRENSYGVLLRLVDEEPYRRLLFSSSENQNEDIRPKLDVYYTIIE